MWEVVVLAVQNIYAGLMWGVAVLAVKNIYGLRLFNCKSGFFKLILNE